MGVVYMMCGLPGSGKSTFAKNLVNSGTYISSDDIREELFGDASVQKNGKLVFDVFYFRAKNCLKNGEDVILDATFIDKKSRKQMFEKLGNDHKYIAYVIDCGVDYAKHNNSLRDRVVPDEVIEKMNKRFVHPSIDEGFSWVFKSAL